MNSVAIAFENGTKMQFFAQSFDLEAPGRSSEYGLLKRHVYKDSNGEDAFVYPNLSQVVGITVAPVSESGNFNISLT